MRNLLPAIVVITICSVTPAADTVHVCDAPLSKPRKTKDKRATGPADHVPLYVWLPDGVTTVRGAIFNPFNETTVEQKHWQAAARLWGFALIGADYFGVSKEDFAPSLTRGLTKLARDIKRPELAHIPFVMVGMSAGAGMSMQFATQIPERIIAVGAVCLEVGPTTDETRKIPIMTVFGERDGKQMELLQAKLPEQRKLGARWAIAVQWGKKHEFAAANSLVMPFFDSCIKLRLPKDWEPTQGPAKLKEIPEKAGWLGYVEGWGRGWNGPAISNFDGYTSDKATACWFPDAHTATVWQAFVVKQPSLAITSPVSLNRTFEPGQPITVKIATSHQRTFLRVGQYGIGMSGGFLENRTDKADTVTIEKLEPGIHPLIAYADDFANMGWGPSRPVTIIVNKPTTPKK